MSTAVKEYKNSFVRMSGINIPSKKKILVGLAMIFGIGIFRAKKMCVDLGIDIAIRMGDLDENQLNQIRKYIEEHFIVEGDLRAEISSNIKTMVVIGCYKGMRHRKGLPVHGQRTKTNAKTRKKRKA